MIPLVNMFYWIELRSPVPGCAFQQFYLLQHIYHGGLYDTISSTIAFHIIFCFDKFRVFWYKGIMNTIHKKANTITIWNHFWDCSAGLPTAPVETQNYIIIQVAESYYKSHFCTENHLQCCDLEITYALTNGLTCATDDLTETVDKNECYLSFRNDCHELSSRRGCRFQTLAINFKGAVAK